MASSKTTRKGQEISSAEDLRYFENPFLNEPCCNDPAKAEGKLPAELVVKLKHSVSVNTAAIDEAYLGTGLGDHSVYTGTTGIALLHYHLACSGDSPEQHLELAVRYLQSSLQSLDGRRHTFLCGASGPLAVAALVYHKLNNGDLVKMFVSALHDLFTRARGGLSEQPSELLYGHVGLLYSLLLVNQAIPGSFQDSLIEELVEAVLSSGVRGREEGVSSPLMFTWHHRHYLGAAHGLAGILTLLLQVPVKSPRVLSLVRPCVDYLLSVRHSSGNLPSSLESQGEDRLVHWCHGAPGAVTLFCLAHKVWGGQQYLDAARLCGEVVWRRGLLRKGYGLCHGVAGNAYTFIQLHKLTGEKHYLERVIKFAEWCLSCDQRQCPTPSTPHSLFEGLAGTTLFYSDVLNKLQSATFPAFEL